MNPQSKITWVAKSYMSGMVPVPNGTSERGPKSQSKFMTANKTIKELEELQARARRIRIENRHARWFVEIMKGIESLISAAVKCVDHLARSTTNPPNEKAEP